jgi:hypothetical protein
MRENLFTAKPHELKLPPNFPKRCKNCIHYAKEVKYHEKFIKGNFCARIVDWPDKYQHDKSLIDPCTSYMKRDPKVVRYLRECAPLIIDMDHFF